MYHRILPIDDPRARITEPGMQVTPRTFHNHMLWLRDFFEPVLLADWLDRASSGSALPQRACAVTFDDGWRDNFEYALPILRQTATPATVFIVSDMVGSSSEFWPSRLARILFENGGAIAQNPKAAWLQQMGVNSKATITPDLISSVINACKVLPDSELNQRMDVLESTLGRSDYAESPTMDWEQIQIMMNSGLVDVGSHTCFHTRLTETISEDEILREIVDSQAMLQAKLARPIRLFCYPNGNFSSIAYKLVRQHYDAAVTTRRGINTIATPRHLLMRIGLHEDVSSTQKEFSARLSGWL